MPFCLIREYFTHTGMSSMGINKEFKPKININTSVVQGSHRIKRWNVQGKESSHIAYFYICILSIKRLSLSDQFSAMYCRAFDSGAVPSCFNHWGLWRFGFEQQTFRLPGIRNIDIRYKICRWLLDGLSCMVKWLPSTHSLQFKE